MNIVEVNVNNNRYLYSRCNYVTIYAEDNKREALIKLLGTSKQKSKIKDAKLSVECVRKTLSNPFQIVFEVTQRCNLACVYCAYGPMYNISQCQRTKDMEWETAKKILDYYMHNPEHYHPVFLSNLDAFESQQLSFRKLFLRHIHPV